MDTRTRKTIERPAFRMRWPQTFTYPSVARPNHLLNHPKNMPSGPGAGFLGRNNSAESAGLSGSVVHAEALVDRVQITLLGKPAALQLTAQQRLRPHHEQRVQGAHHGETGTPCEA